MADGTRKTVVAPQPNKATIAPHAKASKTNDCFQALEEKLLEMGSVAIAVSGGVDSMTLAVFAHRLLKPNVEILHATSPAVPPEGTERVRRYAAREGWNLSVFDAGEFQDPEYLQNPSNRCYFCKSNLYDTIRRHAQGVILSGTNFDDLSDFRPGLEAAKDHAVQHPFVEAGITKQQVRDLAKQLGLTDLADLPASPCLSSRVETGIRIEPETLGAVHAIEKLVGEQLQPAVVRCRVRKDGMVVELDGKCLASLNQERRDQLERAIETTLQGLGKTYSIRFAEYEMGSAFIRPDPVVKLDQ